MNLFIIISTFALHRIFKLKNNMKNLFVLITGVLILISFNCSRSKDTKEQQTEKQIPSVSSVKDSLPKTNENVPATIKDLVFGVKDIPANLKYDGKIITSAKWKDKNGDNIIIITETEIKETANKKDVEADPDQSKKLFGYHYILENNSGKLLWKIQDFVDKCPASIECTYVPNSLSITDLNNNGIGESTFLYILGCRGDVSPVGMKLMMHENDIKYALRGESQIKSTDGIYGGKIDEVDPSFKKAPDGFLDYAKKQWEKFKTEKLED